nr:MAG TPA: hypothetical protein [Caudoviricetes sp.]
MDFPLSSAAIISTQVEQELNAPSIVMPVNFRKNPKNFFGLRILIRIRLFQTIPSFLQIDMNLSTVIFYLFLVVTIQIIFIFFLNFVNHPLILSSHIVAVYCQVPVSFFFEALYFFYFPIFHTNNDFSFPHFYCLHLCTMPDCWRRHFHQDYTVGRQ